MGCMLDGDGNKSSVAPQPFSFTLLGAGVLGTIALLRLSECAWAEGDGEIILELVDTLINGVDEVPRFWYRFSPVSNEDAHFDGVASDNLADIPLLEDGMTLFQVGSIVGVLDAVKSRESATVDRRTPTTVMVTCDVFSFIKSFKPP